MINALKKFTALGKTIIFSIDPNHIDKQFLTLLRATADIYMSIELKEFAGSTVRVMQIHRFKRPNDLFITYILQIGVYS